VSLLEPLEGERSRWGRSGAPEWWLEIERANPFPEIRCRGRAEAVVLWIAAGALAVAFLVAAAILIPIAAVALRGGEAGRLAREGEA